MLEMLTNLHPLKFLVHSWSHQLFSFSSACPLKDLLKAFVQRRFTLGSVCSTVYITLIEKSITRFKRFNPICVSANESPSSLASDEVMTTFAWRSKHYQIWWIDAFTSDFSCKWQTWLIVTGKTSWLWLHFFWRAISDTSYVGLTCALTVTDCFLSR